MEFVDLKKKNQKTDAFVKFKNNSGILDEILESQISPFDTYGLGYKKEGEKSEVGTWSPKTPEAGPSFPKLKARLHLHNTKKTSKDQKDIKKLVPLLNPDSEERQLQDGIKHPGMNMVLKVIDIHVMILVTKL